MGRYELRTITPHGPTICAIFDNLDDAIDALQIRLKSQDLPVIIYDADEEQPIIPTPKDLK